MFFTTSHIFSKLTLLKRGGLSRFHGHENGISGSSKLKQKKPDCCRFPAIGSQGPSNCLRQASLSGEWAVFAFLRFFWSLKSQLRIGCFRQNGLLRWLSFGRTRRPFLERFWPRSLRPKKSRSVKLRLKPPWGRRHFYGGRRPLCRKGADGEAGPFRSGLRGGLERCGPQLRLSGSQARWI